MDPTMDIKTFSEFFTLYKGRFVRFAYNYIRDEYLAEDFTSEALISYWENRETLDPESHAPAYILKIIKNKCLNHLQHQLVRQEATSYLISHHQWELQTRISSLEACDPELVFHREIIDIVEKTLEKLPRQTEIVFRMSRMENKSHKEIAQYLGITVKGVDFHITKALKQLRVNLKDYMPFFLYFFA